MELLVTLYLILSQLILREECPQIIFKCIELLIVPKPTLDPLAQLVIDHLFFVPLINEENARIVTLMSNAATNDLIDFSNGSHLVPVVTCNLLVMMAIQVSHLITWHSKVVLVGVISDVKRLLWLRGIFAARLVTPTDLIKELFLQVDS